MNKYCPSCGAEYRSGFTHCSDCGIELSTTPPDPNNPSAPKGASPLHYRSDLVEVYRSNPMDANLVRQMLESNGIATVFKSSGTGGAYPMNVGALADSIVLVVRDDAPVAREIIELSMRADDEAPDEIEDDYDDYEDYEGPYIQPWYRTPAFMGAMALLLAVILFLAYTGN